MNNQSVSMPLAMFVELPAPGEDYWHLINIGDIRSVYGKDGKSEVVLHDGAIMTVRASPGLVGECIRAAQRTAQMITVDIAIEAAAKMAKAMQ